MNFKQGTLAALLLCASLGFASGQKPQPKITMEQAKATALAKHSGTIKSSELEKEHGKLIYSFDIQTAKELREIQVDAMTGKIVQDTVESAAQEAKEAAQDKQKGQTQPKHNKRSTEPQPQ